MEHIAIDLGGRESQICIRASDGSIVEEDRRATASLGKYLAKRPPARVVLESCAEAFAIAEAARKTGHEVTVVPASLVRALGVGSRGLKNDVRDARNLSEASCRMARLPAVHIPRAENRELKAVCGMREALVQVRTKLVNTARSWLRTSGIPPMRRGAPETLTARYRKHVQEKAGNAIPAHVERILAAIESMNQQVEAADVELEKLAAQHDVCKLLMTTPGVGPVTAARFVAVVDDVSRFPNAHAVESYLGLTPGEDSSSERKRTTGITKAGQTRMRWALVQAAWAARRCRQKDPMLQWAVAVEERRGRRVAITALARKIAGILYAIWRDHRAYSARSAAGVADGGAPTTIVREPTAPPACAPLAGAPLGRLRNTRPAVHE
jgi:transposase